MKQVITNTTPLIGLSLVGKFEVLRSIFGQIIVPEAVYQETIFAGTGKPGSDELKRAETEGWIQVVRVNPAGVVKSLQTDLDLGESEAIAWAFENHADLLLIDEYKGRAKAIGMGVHITGTIGVLLLAREADLLKDIRPELDLLRSHGFRISDSLYKQMLRSK